MSIEFVDKTSSNPTLTESDVQDAYEFTGSIGSLLGNWTANLSDVFTIDTACDSSHIMTLIKTVNEGEAEERGDLEDELTRRDQIRGRVIDTRADAKMVVEDLLKITTTEKSMKLANILFRCSDGKSVSAEYRLRTMKTNRRAGDAFQIRFFKDPKVVEGKA